MNKRTDTTKNLIQIFSTFGFYQHINQPTRKTAKTKSIIDVIYIKTNMKIDSFIDKSVLSDHYLVGTSRYLGHTQPQYVYVKGRSYKNYNYELAKKFYDTQRRDLIFSYNDPNLIWTKLLSFINKCANTLCPYKEMEVRQNKPPWITNELIEILHERDQAFEEAYSSNNQNSWVTAKNLRASAKKAVRNACTSFIQDTLDKNSDNPRKFWLNLNKLIKGNSSTAKINLLDNNNVPLTDETTPNYINQFFATIGPNLAEKFTTTDTPVYSPSTSSSVSSTSLDYISEESLLKEI